MSPPATALPGRLRIGILGCSLADARRYAEVLQVTGLPLEVRHAGQPEALRALIEQEPPQIFLLDCDAVALPYGQAVETVRARLGGVPIILLAGCLDGLFEIAALRVVHDLIDKQDMQRLRFALLRARRQLAEHQRLTQATLDAQRWESRYHRVQARAAEAVAFVERGRHILCSDAYAAHFGYLTGRDMQGIALQDLIAPHDHDELARVLGMAERQSGLSQGFATDCRRLGGGHFRALFDISAQHIRGQCEAMLVLQDRAEETTAPGAEQLEPTTAPIRAERAHPAVAPEDLRLAFQPIVDLNGSVLQRYLVQAWRSLGTAPYNDAASWLQGAEQRRDWDRWQIDRALVHLVDERRLNRRAVFFVRPDIASITDPEFLLWVCDRMRGRHVNAGWLGFMIGEEALHKIESETLALVTGLQRIQSPVLFVDYRGDAAQQALVDRLSPQGVVVAPEITAQASTDASRLTRVIRQAQAHQLPVIVPAVDSEVRLVRAWQAGAGGVMGEFVQRAWHDLAPQQGPDPVASIDPGGRGG